MCDTLWLILPESIQGMLFGTGQDRKDRGAAKTDSMAFGHELVPRSFPVCVPEMTKFLKLDF
jgi:hypothetical protein